MGRAIDMEKDIDDLKMQVDKLENIVRGMSHNMDVMVQKSSKVKHIDLVDDVKSNNKKENVNGSKEKANNKGSSGSSGNDNSGNGNSKSKNNKSGKSSS